MVLGAPAQFRPVLAQSGPPRRGRSILCELALERGPADPQQLRGPGAIALDAVEHALDVEPLQLVQPLRRAPGGRGRVTADLRWEEVERDGAVGGEDQGALQRV